MGNRYTNVALKDVNPTEALRRLRQLGRHAIVNPAQNGWVTVFDEECDTFDLDLLESLALTLSTEHRCIALPCFNELAQNMQAGTCSKRSAAHSSAIRSDYC
jgi:hypothetical protein